jgi:tRNA-specific 2-thiouridylase
VRFDEPQEGVAPGQAIVLYDDTRVIGSATIDATSAHASSSLAGHHQ